MTDERPTAEEVARVVGYDVAALTATEMTEKGIRIVPGIITVEGKGKGWKLHSEYDGVHGPHLEMAKAYARQTALQHVRRHGSIDGLELPRAFPCPGLFRVADRGERGHYMTVECNVCGERVGVHLADAGQQEAPF
jgi:hypothetical protein